MVDAAGRWSVGEALQAGLALEQRGIKYFEDPVSADDFAGCAQLARSLDLAIVSGQYLYSRFAIRQLLEASAVDGLVLDYQRIGGVTEWRRCAALAHTWNLSVAGLVSPQINLHLQASVPNSGLFEYDDWWDDLFEEKITWVDGAAIVPDRPGFGFTLREDMIKTYGIASETIRS
jgi:L-alanine-DL-glutamate epimerase-like enolase superfamily enzyme